MNREGKDLLAAKPERSRLRGTLGSRCRQARRRGVKRERLVGWGARAGRQYGTLGALNKKPMVYNVQPKYRNTLRATYAGDQYDASGRHRGTLTRDVGPMRAVNVTPVVGNVEP